METRKIADRSGVRGSGEAGRLGQNKSLEKGGGVALESGRSERTQGTMKDM